MIAQAVVAGAAAAMSGFSQMGVATLANVGVSLRPLSPVYALPVIFTIKGLLGSPCMGLGLCTNQA